MQAVIDTPSELAPTVESEAFHLLIAYEDSTCHKHAQKTCCHVISELGTEVIVTKSEWKFELLQSRCLQTLAAEDQRLADMIIIAAHGGRDLAPDVKDWIGGWGVSDRDRALVAVLLGCQSLSENTYQVRNYLHEAARCNGMDFFALDLEATVSDDVNP